MKLIVPAAGESKRFPNMRPKFLLTHPLGYSMLTASLISFKSQLKLLIDEVIIVTTQNLIIEIDLQKLRKELEINLEVKVTIQVLEKNTSSMVQTISEAIKNFDEDYSILIKDSDNSFQIDLNKFNSTKNSIAFADISKQQIIKIMNKSFVFLDQNYILQNISEKNNVNQFIYVGLCKFQSSSDFISAAKSINVNREIYVSDVIHVAMNQGNFFSGHEVQNYKDWGTSSDWIKYKKDFSTLFVDLDGVIFLNSNPLNKEIDWNSTQILEKNINYLVDLQSKKNITLIFTTSRNESFREVLEIKLRKLGFDNFLLLMSLPHSRRILINDYANSNPFPSAVALNLYRDSQTLADQLEFLFD